MNSFAVAFAQGYMVLRLLVFAAAVAVGVGCLLAWLVRTRRLSPFSPVARMVRRTMDPILAPVERRIVRSGGLPSNAPWWLLAVVIVGGIILLSVIQFLFGQIVRASTASAQGPVGILVLLVGWLFALLQIALVVRVLSSWVNGSPYSPWLRWAFVLTEPILAPLRRVVPTIGMIDIAPIVAYILLRVLEGLVLGALT